MNMSKKKDANLNDVSKTLLEVLSLNGEEGLYNYLCRAADRIIMVEEFPEADLIELSDKFFSLYRSVGEENFFILGKVLRRAAHSIYRKSFKFYPNKKINSKKFLNLIKG